MNEKDRDSTSGVVVWANGPVVRARSDTGFRMLEVVMVGRQGLVGEVIGIEGALAAIQVYEDTSGLRPGEPVVGSGAPLSIELGPGLVSAVMDGIQRPLERLREAGGDFITRGVVAPRLDRERRWEFEPRLAKGCAVAGGEILGIIPETPLVEHRIMIPYGVSGELVAVAGPGTYTVEETIARVATAAGEIRLSIRQRWQVR